jgi:hypothetical protein
MINHFSNGALLHLVKKEIKMNSKRTLVISIVAVLAIVLGVGAFLAFPRSANSARQVQEEANPAVNSKPANGWDHNVGEQNQAVDPNINRKATFGWDHNVGEQKQVVDPNINRKAEFGWDHNVGDPTPAANNFGWDHDLGR